MTSEFFQNLARWLMARRDSFPARNLADFQRNQAGREMRNKGGQSEKTSCAMPALHAQPAGRDGGGLCRAHLAAVHSHTNQPANVHAQPHANAPDRLVYGNCSARAERQRRWCDRLRV